MRKHDVRKWLHAVLDLLPVILIPVFMIYSHRHTIDSGSIQVPQNEVVDFNQNVENGNFVNGDNWSYSTNFNVTFNNNASVIVATNFTSDWVSLYQHLQLDNNSHKYLLRAFITSTTTRNRNSIGLTNSNITDFVSVSVANTRTLVYSYIDGLTGNDSYHQLQVYPFGLTATTEDYAIVEAVMLFDLTQMFGSGNEPTATQFNTLYSNDYYEYTLSRKELLKGTSTITYDDTDIMSQVVYQLYNSVDKYFNMGNVFNMTGVYDWFNLNIFNGNAPISIYIVWNIVLYEFVMDLLFLLYGLFMWFIDMVEKLMEKPLKSVK